MHKNFLQRPDVILTMLILVIGLVFFFRRQSNYANPACTDSTQTFTNGYKCYESDKKKTFDMNIKLCKQCASPSVWMK